MVQNKKYRVARNLIVWPDTDMLDLENDKPSSGIEDSVTTSSEDDLPHADLDGTTIVHRDKDDILVA